MKSGAQPGNGNSTAEKRAITSTLRRVVTQGSDKLRAACEKVLDDAVDGNLPSLAFIFDRLEGKPAQTQILEGGEKPVTIDGIVRTLVDPREHKE